MSYSLSEIEAALRASLSPQVLEVRDDSHKHAGHAGHVPGLITHVQVRIGGGSLLGLGRIAAHRMVNHALRDFFSRGLHALSIVIK